MLSRGKPAGGNRPCRAVGQYLHQGMGIFVSNYSGHGEGEHGVAAWKGSVHRVVAKEAALSGTFIGAFTAGKDLHRSGYREGVGQGFQSELSSLFGVCVSGL